jgi:hypothetical protein
MDKLDLMPEASPGPDAEQTQHRNPADFRLL